MNTKIAANNMITQQLRTGNVLDESILDLYRSIPREDFVPSDFHDFAYSDMQIPLANKQIMLTPLEEATILQNLNLTGNEIILEIGTGTGFFTAMLSRLAKKVISIEYFEEFTKNAKILLDKHKCNNVELITTDGARGYVEKAPYDVIIISGAIKNVSNIQRLQLLSGGKLVAIIGESPIMQVKIYHLNNNRLLSKLAAESEVRGDEARRTAVYTSVHEDSSTESTKQFTSAVEFRKKSNDTWTEKLLFETNIPPLIDKLNKKQFIF